MWHNLGRRLAGLMIVMFLVAAMVFFLTRLAPGDPASLMLGDQATAEDIAQLRQVYGLDKPVPGAVRALAEGDRLRQPRANRYSCSVR